MNSIHTGGNSGAASGAGGNDARDKLMNDMKNIIHEAEDWLNSNAGGEEALPLKEKFESTLKTTKTDLLKLQADMLAKTRLAAQATDAYVKDNPWKSIGLGAAIGVVFGLLISRK
ncbi:MAG TPA: DUF883 domain-containing protein [Janthinobacterium sp.]|nr:DUF883 domain-containing protein [Janthinobacterium sp.]